MYEIQTFVQCSLEGLVQQIIFVLHDILWYIVKHKFVTQFEKPIVYNDICKHKSAERGKVLSLTLQGDLSDNESTPNGPINHGIFFSRIQHFFDGGNAVQL